MVQFFFALKNESVLSKMKRNQKIKVSSIFSELKEKLMVYPGSPQIKRQTLNNSHTFKKKLENTSKKNDSVLHESKQNLSISEFKEEINQDRVETSRNSLSMTGNIIKRRVLTCANEDSEKENMEIGRGKSRSFFKNRRYKNKEKNDSFNFPQPLKTLS